MTAASAVSYPRIVRRLPFTLALAVLVGIGAGYLYWDVAAWRLDDLDVYWNAALRIRDGAPLYGEEGVSATRAYRYAPWFAYAWVPATYLPRPVVNVAWSILLLACSYACLRPLVPVRSRAGLLLVIMMLPILVAISGGGNVQAPMLAALLYRLPKRDAPIWIALAASLKVVPVLLTLHLVAERRFAAALVTLALTAALWLPILAFPVSGTTSDPGLAGALIRVHPVLYAGTAVAAAALAGYLAWRRSAHVTLASVTAMILALPRLFVYDVTWVLLGTITPRRPAQGPDGEEGRR